MRSTIYDIIRLTLQQALDEKEYMVTGKILDQAG